MKKLLFALCMIPFLTFYGCKKDNEDPEENKESNAQLRTLVPEAYLDEAKKLGFKIYEGNTPPNVTGEYQLAPWRFDGKNYGESGTGTAVGYINEKGFKILLSDQSGSEITVTLSGYYEGAKLSEPFIIGSGNNFTICQHVIMTGGMGALFSYPYARLTSGTIEGGKLKNVQMATIGLELETPNAAGYTVHGEVDLWSDADGVSE